MPKDHLKRIAAPSSWEIARKTSKFVARPYGYLNEGMPVTLVIGEVLKLSGTRKETKKIIREGKISIDGKAVKDERAPLVLMSVIKIDCIGAYRMLLNTRGKLFLKKEDAKHESAKPCKIVSKTSLKKGKTQLGFHDGRTVLADKTDAKVGDTFVFKTPDFRQYEHLKFEKGATVFLTGGNNVGKTGKIEGIASNVLVKINDSVIQAARNNILIIGESIQTA